jgi:hypothetical protein
MTTPKAKYHCDACRREMTFQEYYAKSYLLKGPKLYIVICPRAKRRCSRSFFRRLPMQD